LRVTSKHSDSQSHLELLLHVTKIVGPPTCLHFQEEWKMRDLVVEKASPFALSSLSPGPSKAPENLLRGILYDICLNACGFFGHAGRLLPIATTALAIRANHCDS